MPWKLLDRPKTFKVTRALATKFMQMDPAPHDRILSERRLIVYRKLFAAGSFRPVTWAQAYCEETEGVYRVNGKHTSTLLAGLEPLPDFYVTIEEYHCDTLVDVAQLYATFDSKMQSRTATDIYRSFAATDTELAAVPNRVLFACAGGIPYQIYGEDLYGRTQPVDRAELLLEHSDFVTWVAALMTEGPTAAEVGSRSRHRGDHLCRQPIIAAMFATWQKNASAATTFWKHVRDENDPTPESPTRVLSRFLLVTGLRSGIRVKGKIATTREVFVKSLHGWNAWRKGESTKLQYYADKPLPAVHG